MSEDDLSHLSPDILANMQDYGWEKMETSKLLQHYFSAAPLDDDPAMIHVVVTEARFVRVVARADTHERLERIEHKVDQAIGHLIDIKQICQAVRRSLIQLNLVQIPRYFIVLPAKLEFWDLASVFCAINSAAPQLMLLLSQVATLTPPTDYSFCANAAMDSISHDRTARVEELVNAEDTLVNVAEHLVKQMTDEKEAKSLLQIDEKRYGSDNLDQLKKMEGSAMNEMKKFLKAESDANPGNLVRSVDQHGNVEWLCDAHYKRADRELLIDQLKTALSRLTNGSSNAADSYASITPAMEIVVKHCDLQPSALRSLKPQPGDIGIRAIQ
ncbi:hypothetical protein HDV00_002522 [Rhizophlyctis rosea]|nr:hypothetical protein HDV00_002522 [Rhizophlyctis rosea]